MEVRSLYGLNRLENLSTSKSQGRCIPYCRPRGLEAFRRGERSLDGVQVIRRPSFLRQ